MTDRELLEMAANAAGLRATGHYDFQCGLEVSAPHNAPYYWNPLEDDGDAFRLALALHIQADASADYTCIAVTNYGWREAVTGRDRAQSMRRAIVLAVADHEKKKQRDLYASQYVHK